MSVLIGPGKKNAGVVFLQPPAPLKKTGKNLLLSCRKGILCRLFISQTVQELRIMKNQHHVKKLSTPPSLPGQNKKRYIKIWIFILAVFCICFLICASAILGVRYFLKEKLASALTSKDIAGFSNTINKSGLLADEDWTLIMKTMDNIPEKIKKPVIEMAARRSIEELRNNFKGLKTEEAKDKKVQELIKYIENDLVLDENLRKLFTKEFLKAGMDEYMKKLSPEERTLYDPIVHKFINKMNSK